MDQRTTAELRPADCRLETRGNMETEGKCRMQTKSKMTDCILLTFFVLLFLLSIANSKQTNLSVIQGTLSDIQAIKPGALVRPTNESADLNSD